MQSYNSRPTIQTTRRERWYGALIGLVPLGLLVGIVGLALVLTGVVRAITVGQSLAAEQTGTVTTLAVGVVVAVVASIVALVRVWRQMRAWQRAGNVAEASGAFWVLAAASLIVLLPFILALLWPQHPAP